MAGAARDHFGNRRHNVKLSIPQIESLLRLIADEEAEPGDEDMLVHCGRILRSARKDARA